MILEPPKRTYGLSPSVVSVVILLTIVFAAVNVFLVSRTDYGASFYANWLAGRVLFAQGQNPYSAGIFENIVLRHTHDVRVSGFTYVRPYTFTVQFHPEACAGPHDTQYLFE